MKRVQQIAVLSLLSAYVTACSTSKDEFATSSGGTSKLVGIWATKDAVLKDEFLFEGAAVYLGSDGVGAIVGGPPPIGARIEGTFDSENNTFSYQMTADGKTREGKLLYDPATDTMVVEGHPDTVMHRRFDELTDSVRENLGLEPYRHRQIP